MSGLESATDKGTRPLRFTNHGTRWKLFTSGARELQGSADHQIQLGGGDFDEETLSEEAIYRCRSQ